MQVHEAAAVVESGGDAGAEWRPSTLPVIERLCAYAGLGPALPGVGMGYSLSKSIYNLRTSTRAPHVSAAPVRCRKVVYPGGCTARPGS